MKGCCVMKNDYDKFATSRHDEIKKGIKKSICYVERPMMESMIPDLKDKKVLVLGCGTGEETEILKPFVQKVEKGQMVEVSEIKKVYQEAVGHEIGSGQIYRVLWRHG